LSCSITYCVLLVVILFAGKSIANQSYGTKKIVAHASMLLAEDASLPPSASTIKASNHKAIGELIAETGFYQSIALTSDSPLLAKRSKYQEIAVHNSKHYGKILVLDGVVQLTERDADSYNEMMAHMPMMAHLKPRRVLVIGGGDGYVLSEVLKHPSVEHVDHVDLDGDVIETCREHFSWGKSWEDPRVALHIEDGSKFVRNAPSEYYDVIIQDSSDPFTQDDDGTTVELPSSVLYSSEHIKNVKRILKKDGVYNFQAETIHIPSDLEGVVEWRSSALEIGFKSAKYGSVTISSYPTGQIGFLMCQKGSDNEYSTLKDVKRRFGEMEKIGQGTTYYHPRLQISSFDLPLWVQKSIYSTTEREAMFEDDNDEL